VCVYIYMCAHIFFLFFFPFKIFFIPLSLSPYSVSWMERVFCFCFKAPLLLLRGGGGSEQEEEEVAEVTVKHSRPKYRIEKEKKICIPHPVHRHTFTTHAAAGAAAPRNGSRDISPPPSPRAHSVNGEQPEHPRGWLLMAQELKDSSPAVAHAHRRQSRPSLA
jgi:hypothetical protein